MTKTYHFQTGNCEKKRKREKKKRKNFSFLPLAIKQTRLKGAVSLNYPLEFLHSGDFEHLESEQSGRWVEKWK